jgi:hypothetical protein
VKRTVIVRDLGRVAAIVLATALAALMVTAPSARAVSGGNPPLKVLSWSTYTDSVGYLWVVGEVENTGSVTAEFGQVDLAYEDGGGTLLATDEAFTLLDSINPGQKSPFETIAPPPSGYVQTVITGISDFSSSTPANTNFTTVVTNTYIDGSGFPNIVGTVTNDNTTTASYVEVVFTFYDSSGNVADADFTFIQPQPPSLAAGQAADLQEIDTSGVPYSSYACVAYSDTPPSTPVVTAKLTLSLSGLTSGAMTLGKRVTAAGNVTPTSLAGGTVTLTVQRKQGGEWVTVKSVARTISLTGAYSWKYKPAKRGAYRMRATIAKTYAHTAAKTTWRTLKVK